MFHIGLFQKWEMERSSIQKHKHREKGGWTPGEKITGRPQKTKNGDPEYIIEEEDTYLGKTGKGRTKVEPTPQRERQKEDALELDE